MLMLVVILPLELWIAYDFHFWTHTDVQALQQPPLFRDAAAPVYH